MSVAATSLITLAQFKTYAGITSSEWDSQLEPIIDAVSEMFDAHIGRKLAKTVYSSVYIDGNDKEWIALPNYPIVSITSVYEDDVLLTEGVDDDFIFYADSGLLRRVGGVTWWPSPKAVQVTYTAGYVVQGASPGSGETALPADIKHAAFLQCYQEWKRVKEGSIGETSRTFPDGSVSQEESGGLLRAVRDILARYRSAKVA